MIIEKFRVGKLFGIIDADLAFKQDLNVIIGRNASGKTSVLSLLSAFMHLDVETIKATPFESATLEILHDQDRICLAAANDSERAYISIEWGSRSVKTPLSDELNPRGIKRILSPSLLAFYGVSTSAEAIEASQAWLEVSRAFKKSARLTFVRLDRTVIAVNAEGEEAQEGTVPLLRNSATKGAAKDPLDLVIEATRDRYYRFRRELNIIRYEAYRAMMGLHFKPVKISSTRKNSNIAELEKKLETLRTRVTRSQVAQEIRETDLFFKSFETLLQQAKIPATRRAGRKSVAEESLQIMLESSSQQIEGLLKIFDHEQKRAVVAELEWKTYLSVIDGFLKESGKKLWFSDERFELAFYVPAIGEGPEGPGRSLKSLSSGERQVVIVLTYLAFLSGPNSIFIIDEPELSLHLRWQGFLMQALKKLRPEGGQIIVATHAPELAGRAPGNCIPLRQAYMPALDEVDDGE